MRAAARPDHPVAAAFQRRAARAEALAAAPGSAAEPLRFAAGLNDVQAAVAAQLIEWHAARPFTGRLETDGKAVIAQWPDVLRFAADHGPAGLAGAARARAEESCSVRMARLAAYWGGDPALATDYLARAALRPYVEVLAFLRLRAERPRGAGTCPFCGGRPWIGARRAPADGDGATRHLGCALCGGEWKVNRALCPCCGEQDPARLPSYASASSPLVRIEACESCLRYVKTIDLTLDGHAVPEVDDLASLALDLWAAREGFARIEPGLAGPVAGPAYDTLADGRSPLPG